MAEKVKLLYGTEEYKIEVDGEESDPAEYGDLCELVVGDDRYLAVIHEDGGTGKRFSMFEDGDVIKGRVVGGVEYDSYDELADEEEDEVEDDSDDDEGSDDSDDDDSEGDGDDDSDTDSDDDEEEDS